MNDIAMIIYLLFFSYFVNRYYTIKVSYLKLFLIIPLVFIICLMDFKNFIFKILSILASSLVLVYILDKQRNIFYLPFLFFNVNSIIYLFVLYTFRLVSFVYVILIHDYSNIFETISNIICILIPIFSCTMIIKLKNKGFIDFDLWERRYLLINVINILMSYVNISCYWLYNENFISIYIYLIIIIYMVVSGLLALYFNKNLKELEKRKKEDFNEMLHERLESFMNSYQEEEKEIRSIKHDIKNHLTIIKHLENKEDINRYINKVLPSIDNLNVMGVQLTGNVYLDAILYSKKNEYPNVKLNWDIYISKLKIDEVDLCILIFNLLDNACNAASKVNGEVNLNIQFDVSHLFIEIRNTCLENESANLSFNNSEGLGLKIISAIIDKYNGKIEAKTLNNLVSIIIGLTLKE